MTSTADAQQRPSAVKLFELGLEKLDEEQYEQALSYLNESIKLNPKYADAYSARAEVRERLNDRDGAMIDYAICVELLPDQYEPLFSLAVIRYEIGRASCRESVDLGGGRSIKKQESYV